MGMKTEEKRLLEGKNLRRRQVKNYLLFGLIGLVTILLLVAYASTATRGAMTACVFCDIVAGKMPNTVIEMETDEYVIFKDIKPASTFHYLCVTKKHIESLKVMTKEDIPLVKRMEEGLKGFFKSKEIDTEDALFGFHMPPFISVKHLHMHGISPRSNMTLMNSFMFKPHSYWFKIVDEAIEYLSQK